MNLHALQMRRAANRIASDDQPGFDLHLEMPPSAFLKEPIRMTTGQFRRAGIVVALCLLGSLFADGQAQQTASATANVGSLQGHVRDASGQPVANATVSLHLPEASPATVGIPWLPVQITHTDSEGAYRFPAVAEGDYVLLGDIAGNIMALAGSVRITRNETKTIDFAVPANRTVEPGSTVPASAASAKPGVSAPDFFDEPQFTVAGVTQATNSGGHGSDTVLRATEALAKATVSLSKAPDAAAQQPPAATESSLRDAVARNPKDPGLHQQLGNIEETLGHPLEAVREYQRAAELDPSEPNLFDWGTELLTHRALEPATEVFTRGNRLFPKSVRMLVALGVASYARGSYAQATQYLGNASDLAPDDPTPYLFLGKMQSVEVNPTQESAERLARFAQRHPDNALANYYYAVSLWKQSAGALDTDHATPRDTERSARVETLLQKAVLLDPKLGAAYLQLGILYSQHKDFSRAISAYQKAIEVSPEGDEMLEEAHYRLARVYLRTGAAHKAQEELQLHATLAKKTKEDAERMRRDIQEFVIALRNQNSSSPPPR
jgi:tetratricopeptide (TPR) repeat protein